MTKPQLFKICPGSKIYRDKDKIIKKYNTKAHDLKREFENQKRAYKIFEKYSGKIRIPKPISYSTKENTITMQYIEGKTLVEYLRKKNLHFKRNKLQEIYEEIGKGLRYFHKNATWKTKTDFDKEMHKRIKEIKLQPIYKHYTKLLKFKPSAKKQRTYGNFKAENIIIAKDKIYFIDFGYDYKTSIYYDLAKLIESTFTAGFRNIRFPLYNFRKLNNLKITLLKGYFGNEKINLKMLNYYQVLFKSYDLSNCKSKKMSFKVLKFIYYLRLKKLMRKINEKNRI